MPSDSMAEDRLKARAVSFAAAMTTSAAMAVSTAVREGDGVGRTQCTEFGWGRAVQARETGCGTHRLR